MRPEGYRTEFTTAFSVALALNIWRNNHGPSPAEWIAIAVFFVLTYWLVGPLRANALVDAEQHDQTRQSIGFRLGKSLKRVLRRLQGISRAT